MHVYVKTYALLIWMSIYMWTCTITLYVCMCLSTSCITCAVLSLGFLTVRAHVQMWHAPLYVYVSLKYFIEVLQYSFKFPCKVHTTVRTYLSIHVINPAMVKIYFIFVFAASFAYCRAQPGLKMCPPPPTLLSLVIR